MNNEERQNIIQEHLENAMKGIKRDLGSKVDTMAVCFARIDDGVMTGMGISGFSSAEVIGMLEMAKSTIVNKS